MPEPFHARFPVSVKSCLQPSAEHVSACGRRNEAPRRTREKTFGTQGTSTSLNRQKLHFVCMHVVVIFQPIITLQEVNAGLALTPKEQVVTVTSGPVLGITFSQFKATVTGSVKCIGKLHVITDCWLILYPRGALPIYRFAPL